MMVQGEQRRSHWHSVHPLPDGRYVCQVPACGFIGTVIEALHHTIEQQEDWTKIRAVFGGDVSRGH